MDFKDEIFATALTSWPALFIIRFIIDDFFTFQLLQKDSDVNFAYLLKWGTS